jgi:hypothetical protein
VHGEEHSAEQWKSTKLQNSLRNFVQMIATILIKAMLDSSLSYKHTTWFGLKKGVIPITVLCCSNISGTDEQRLLITGKRAKPRCFKRISVDSLSVLYCANKNVWVSSEIFKKWVMSWDEKLQLKSKTCCDHWRSVKEMQIP